GREPWRSAAALCWQTGQTYENIPEKDPLLQQAWQKKINAPQSSSVGRLFDAAAALTGMRCLASFEGQGPMELEALANGADRYIETELEVCNKLLITNWQSLLPAMLDSTLTINERACLLHQSLAQALLQQALAIRETHTINTVSFAGGVFQNRVLTERAMALLSAAGFKVYLPELIPVNDAGISFGQIVEHGFSQQE
ncbi:MAG: carbamoyltransferase HypF, partial [Gammaproteobacteria bacterium]|nr:carbamoyltransferase HypF [Gammaproteobacteria bacterium]